MVPGTLGRSADAATMKPSGYTSVAAWVSLIQYPWPGSS